MGGLFAVSKNLTPQPPSLQGKGEYERKFFFLKLAPLLLGEGLGRGLIFPGKGDKLAPLLDGQGFHGIVEI